MPILKHTALALISCGLAFSSLAAESTAAFAAIEVQETPDEIIHHRVLLRPKVDGRELLFLMLYKKLDDKTILEVPVALGSAEDGLEQGNFIIVGRVEQSNYEVEATYAVRGTDDVEHYTARLPRPDASRPESETLIP